MAVAAAAAAAAAAAVAEAPGGRAPVGTRRQSARRQSAPRSDGPIRRRRRPDSHATWPLHTSNERFWVYFLKKIRIQVHVRDKVKKFPCSRPTAFSCQAPPSLLRAGQSHEVVHSPRKGALPRAQRQCSAAHPVVRPHARELSSPECTQQPPVPSSHTRCRPCRCSSLSARPSASSRATARRP